MRQNKPSSRSRQIIFAFLSFCFLSTYYQVTAQLTEKHYKIFSVKTGTEVKLTDIAEDAKNYDVIFFGEEHNDSVIHFLQNNLFELMHQKYENQLSLALEMFDRDVQHIMNEYLDGYIRERNFTKDARAWSNYRDYKPMVEFAKKNKLDVICANSPTRYTNLAGRKGISALKELPAQTKKYFAPLPYDTASGAYYKKLMDLTHEPSNPKDTAAKKAPAMPVNMGGFNMILSQSLWDATMAYSIAEYLKKNKGKKVLMLNGRFHSDEGFGAATQLKKYRSKVKILIISAQSDDSFPTPDWEKLKKNGDYIIVTDPSVPKTFKENKG